MELFRHKIATERANRSVTQSPIMAKNTGQKQFSVFDTSRLNFGICKFRPGSTFYGHDPPLDLPTFIPTFYPRAITNMVNVCKLLFDQFTAEKAANGAVKRAITRGFTDRASQPVGLVVQLRWSR